MDPCLCEFDQYLIFDGNSACYMGVRGMKKCMFTRESNMGVKTVSVGIRPLLY